MKLNEEQHKILVAALLETISEIKEDRLEGELTIKEMAQALDMKPDLVYDRVLEQVAKGTLIKRIGIIAGRKVAVYKVPPPSEPMP